MDPGNELMVVAYGHNKMVANSTIHPSFSVSSSVVPGESNPMKQIIPVNKKVDPEEGAENSIVPPINYYESDIMKATIAAFKKQMDVSNQSKYASRC